MVRATLGNPEPPRAPGARTPCVQRPRIQRARRQKLFDYWPAEFGTPDGGIRTRFRADHIALVQVACRLVAIGFSPLAELVARTTQSFVGTVIESAHRLECRSLPRLHAADSR